MNRPVRSGGTAAALVLGLVTVGCGGAGEIDLELAASHDDAADLGHAEADFSTLLAAQQDVPCGIAIDATSIYWTNFGTDALRGGSVMKMPLAGGAPVELASGFGNPCAIAVDEGGVYWGSYGAQSTGGVYRVAKDGGGAYAVASHLAYPTSLAIHGGRAYWTDFGDGSVRSTSVDAGSTITLATDQQGPIDIAVSGDDLYWAAAGAVMRAAVFGGTAKPKVTGDDDARGIAIGPTALYWITADASILAVPAERGTPTTLVAGSSDGGGIFDIAVHGESVYWSDAVAGTVNVIPAAGGATIELAHGQAEPIAIAVDGATIYWASQGDGTIRRAETAAARQ